MKDSQLENYLVKPDTKIRDVLRCIGRSGKGIALLVDGDRLITTFTDGDVRRGILSDVSLDSPASNLLNDKIKKGFGEPVAAVFGDTASEMLELMDGHGIDHLPVVRDGALCDLVFRRDLVASLRVPISPVSNGVPAELEAGRGRLEDTQVVLMAGGFGKRLMPLTKDVPKPMLPIAGKPILERILEQVRDAGARSFHFTTHFLPDVIRDHFGDGSGWGVNIRYLHEKEPLGTGGALGRVDIDDRTNVLLMNGDLLTRVDFARFSEFHRDERADLTVGVRQFDMEVPYGVVRCTGSKVEAVEEKPSVPFLVNAGIYMISGAARKIVPEVGRYDMTDLISDLVEKGFKVSAFPVVEYWMDIGQLQDYQRAERDQDGFDQENHQ